MKLKENIKYLYFIFILAAGGVVFYFREPLSVAAQNVLKPYRQAVDFSGNSVLADETDEEDVSDGDGLAQSVSEGDAIGDISGGDSGMPEDVSGGDGMENEAEPQPAWEYMEVDETWFDDALFIGDSRTVGMAEYGGLDNATFYASTGLTIYKLFTAEIVPVEGSKQKITIEEALGQRQFAKIYLMIGINEMGTGTVETFMDKYTEVVARLQELQPDAVIYLQAIIRVSSERSAKGDYIHNEGINLRNEEIAKLADNEKIFYLDVNPVICDEDGGLEKSYTFDGVHLMAKYISIWKEFLMEHAVKFN
ncbi:MAG: acylhydrolase [Lachnospiraceae bacterium]|nr:acylhydrolase [Lachnospiraceae bacterium]